MKQLPHWVLTDTFPAFYDSESLTAVQQTARVYAAVQELIDEYNKFVDEINAHIDEYEHNKDAQMDCFIEKITQTMNSYIESIDMKVDSQNLKIAQAIEEMRLAYQTFEASMTDNQQGFEEEITERQTAFETDLTNKFETLVADLETLVAAFSKALVHAIENEGNHFIVGTDSQGVSYDYADTVPSYGVDLTGQTLVNLLPATNNTFISDTTIQNETSVNINMFKASTTYTVFLNDSTSKVTSLVIGGDVELLNTTITNSVFTFSTASSIDSTLEYYVKFYASESNVFVEGEESNISCITLEGDHTDKDISYFEGLKSVGETNGNMVRVLSTGTNMFNGWLPFIAVDVNNGSIKETIDYKLSSNYITVTENTNYFVYDVPSNYSSVVSSNHFVAFYDSNKNYLSRTTGYNTNSRMFKTPDNTAYIVVAMSSPFDSEEAMNEFLSTAKTQMNYGTTKIDYEPYIGESVSTLTLSEPLRSLPNGVKDIAEWKNDKVVVTRRVGQVVLDGSEGWEIDSVGETYTTFKLLGSFVSVNDTEGFISDKFIYTSADSEKINVTTTGIFITIANSKLTTVDVAGFQTWLQSNPVTVAYELATPTTEEYDVAAPELYQHVFIETGSIPTQETTHRVILNMSDQITSNTQTIASLEQRVAQLETLAVTTLPLESEGDL